MEAMAPVLLCKLKKIFPPDFFLLMQHLILRHMRMRHIWGGVQFHWSYPIERTLKVVRMKCKNKYKIEAFITEAKVLEEVSNFTTKYYGENLPSVHYPPPRYNANENESSLSLFQGQLRGGDRGVLFLWCDGWGVLFLSYVRLVARSRDTPEATDTN
jgi:hypothetical protein